MEGKDILDFLGLDSEKIKSIDDLKTVFEPEFVRVSALKDRKDLTDPLVGKRMGSIQTELKRKGKEYAIDFDTDEFKGKSVEEQTGLLLHKMAERSLANETELKAKIGQSNDDAVKEWQTKYEKANKQLGEKDGLITDITTKYQTLEQTTSTQLKERELAFHKKSVFDGIKFKSDLSPIEKKGFDSYISENFKFDLGENNSFEIRDKEGKLIPNPKVTGSYRDALDVLQDEAVKLNLFQLNKDGGKPAPISQQFQPQQIQQQAKTVLINPRAQV